VIDTLKSKAVKLTNQVITLLTWLQHRIDQWQKNKRDKEWQAYFKSLSPAQQTALLKQGKALATTLKNMHELKLQNLQSNMRLLRGERKP